MQLTKEERANIYCMMLSEIDEPLISYSRSRGLCVLYSALFNSWQVELEAPELSRQFHHSYKHWPYAFALNYQGWQRRKQCLLKAIELCEQ